MKYYSDLKFHVLECRLFILSPSPLPCNTSSYVLIKDTNKLSCPPAQFCGQWQGVQNAFSSVKYDKKYELYYCYLVYWHSVQLHESDTCPERLQRCVFENAPQDHSLHASGVCHPQLEFQRQPASSAAKRSISQQTFFQRYKYMIRKNNTVHIQMTPI